MVVDKPGYTIPAWKRRNWIGEVHPTAEVRIFDQPPSLRDDDSPGWAECTKQFFDRAFVPTPDVVFSSEDYGDTWAQCMGIAHVKVDLERSTIPMSATKVRANMPENFRFLSPPVREHYAFRVVCMGAESTGTTTLSQALAKHYQCPWVPEAGREWYNTIRFGGLDWIPEDMDYIGEIQNLWETKAARRTENGIIICDTDAVTTMVWQQFLSGKVTQAMMEEAQASSADLYILTGSEIPFVQDGVRILEPQRQEMQRYLYETVTRWEPYQMRNGRAPVIRCSGTPEFRLETAISAIDKIWKERLANEFSGYSPDDCPRRTQWADQQA
jgi:HTH-type transcriptional repressor of NAD biosynthesis genes